MRVLHVCAGNLYGGIESLLVTLAGRRGVCPAMEPSFALCYEGRLSAELRERGVTVHNIGPARFRHPWTIWAARRRLKSVLKGERLDVIINHSCWSQAVFAPAVGSLSLTMVFWAHNLFTGRHWLEHWAQRTRPALVLANSRTTESSLTRHFPGVPRKVLYLPVAATALEAGEARSRLRATLGIKAGNVVILQFSRLERGKGHALLLAALARLADDPAWTCWIAGSAQRPSEESYLTEIRSMAVQLGIARRVHFLGERSDVPDLLAAADIHCQPNTAPESFGMAFVEALSAGRPVVSTAMGGAQEVIDSSCGLLVSPSPASVADALQCLIHDTDLCQRLGQAGPARAQALCDPTRQIGRLNEVLARPAAGG